MFVAKESMAQHDAKLLRGLFPNHQPPLVQLVDLHQRHPVWWLWFPQTMGSVQKSAEKKTLNIQNMSQSSELYVFFHKHPPRTSQGWMLYKQSAKKDKKRTKNFEQDLSKFFAAASLNQFLDLYPHLKILGVSSTERLIAPLISRLILEGTTKSFSELRTILEKWNTKTPKFNLLKRLMARNPDGTVLQDYAAWLRKNPWDPVLSLAMIRYAIRTNNGLAAVSERVRMKKQYVQQNSQFINKTDIYILKQLMQEGQEAITKGQMDQAKSLYNHALNMPIMDQSHHSQSSALCQELENDAYWVKGLICFTGLKDYQRARDYFIRSAQNLPAHVISLKGIGNSGLIIKKALKKGLRRHDVRALFWAGVCCEYLKKPVLAKAYYRAASLCSTYWYGQLACWKLGIPVKPNFANPVPDKTDWNKASHKEASRIIAIWKNAGGSGASVKAYETTLSLCKDLMALAETSGDYAKVLELIGILYPDYVVESAKSIAKTSHTVFQKLYPILPNIRCSDPALVHSIILAESCFRSNVISWDAGIGIMQIMADTAKKSAKEMGVPLNRHRLINDSAYQIRMGTHILMDYIKKVGSVYAPGIAAYNAGVNRAIPWIQNTPDLNIPEDGCVWIESIPFKDTHHYVLRVMESYITYRSLMGKPVMGKEWDQLLRAHPKSSVSS